MQKNLNKLKSKLKDKQKGNHETIISFRIPNKLLAQINKLAKETATTRTSVIVDAIKIGIDFKEND